MENKIIKEKQMVVESTAGLHALLATKIVQTSSKYSVDINLYYRDRVVDMKSILGLMSLAIPHGHNVRIVATGVRAEEAIADIESILAK